MIYSATTTTINPETGTEGVELDWAFATYVYQLGEFTREAIAEGRKSVTFRGQEYSIKEIGTNQGKLRGVVIDWTQDWDFKSVNRESEIVTETRRAGAQVAIMPLPGDTHAVRISVPQIRPHIKGRSRAFWGNPLQINAKSGAKDGTPWLVIFDPLHRGKQMAIAEMITKGDITEEKVIERGYLTQAEIDILKRDNIIKTAPEAPASQEEDYMARLREELSIGA